MTEKQKERIAIKIKKIRDTLAAERRMSGGYDDSRGLRYLPPELYIEIEDYSGGLTYYRWFKKNFPDDCGFVSFWFSLIIILYKAQKLKEAEKIIYTTYFCKIHVYDKFFGQQFEAIECGEYDYELNQKYVDYFPYTSSQIELKDFCDWLKNFIMTTEFKEICEEFKDLSKRINTENDKGKRECLLKAKYQLIERFK